MTKRGRLRPTVHLQRVASELKREREREWQVTGEGDAVDTRGRDPLLPANTWPTGRSDGTIKSLSAEAPAPGDND